MKQLIIVRKDLINQYGYPKMMVQVAHASTKIITDKIEEYKGELDNYYEIDITKQEYEWSESGYKKIITYVKSEEKLLKICEYAIGKYFNVLIKDNALTVYPEPTYTCIGIMGTDKEMDAISKKFNLQLLK